MKLQGIFPPITTPFNHEGELWKVKVQHNIEKLNLTGLAGYVVCGSTGESVMLTTEEKIQLWEWVAQYAAPEKLLIAGTGVESVRETADEIDVLRETRSGAVFTADIYGGVAPQDARRSFEIRGSEAWLSLTSDHPSAFQAGDAMLRSNIPFVAPDEPAVSGGYMGAAINVGEVYAHLVRDLREGTYTTPGFDHALHNARLIDAIRRASERGERQKITSVKETDLREELLTNVRNVF